MAHKEKVFTNSQFLSDNRSFSENNLVFNDKSIKIHSTLPEDNLSDSDSDTKSDFDEEYYKYRPDPIHINISKIVIIDNVNGKENMCKGLQPHNISNSFSEVDEKTINHQSKKTSNVFKSNVPKATVSPFILDSQKLVSQRNGWSQLAVPTQSQVLNVPQSKINVLDTKSNNHNKHLIEKRAKFQEHCTYDSDISMHFADTSIPIHQTNILATDIANETGSGSISVLPNISNNDVKRLVERHLEQIHMNSKKGTPHISMPHQPASDILKPYLHTTKHPELNKSIRELGRMKSIPVTHCQIDAKIRNSSTQSNNEHSTAAKFHAGLLRSDSSSVNNVNIIQEHVAPNVVVRTSNISTISSSNSQNSLIVNPTYFEKFMLFICCRRNRVNYF